MKRPYKKVFDKRYGEKNNPSEVLKNIAYYLSANGKINSDKKELVEISEYIDDLNKYIDILENKNTEFVQISSGKFTQIGSGPEQFAIIKSGWLNNMKNGLYHLIYEDPQDGDLSYDHYFLYKDEMIKKFPFTKIWFDKES